MEYPDGTWRACEHPERPWLSGMTRFHHWDGDTPCKGCAIAIKAAITTGRDDPDRHGRSYLFDHLRSWTLAEYVEAAGV